MSYSSPISCWPNEVPRSRNRICHISCHWPSHRSVEVFMERATFAAGSFERVEEAFRRIEGVQQTMVGYAGGWAPDPRYFDVCTGATRHPEVVEIYLNPGQVSYQQLLNAFWDSHDPTSFNRQGSDVGSQYRSAIFFHSLEQEATARASKERLQRSGRFTRPIVTEIVPATRFYRGEENRQHHNLGQARAVFWR